jgi:hypothetical protein
MWHCCQGVDEDYNLNIFEMIMNTNELAKELVIRKLFIFKQSEVDVKNIKHPLQWWEKHEMERIISLVILTNLKRCHVQSQKLNNLIFVNKNWFNDPWIGCKPSFNMVEVDEIDVDSFKEFEEFKQAFERDEVVEV